MIQRKLVLSFAISVCAALALGVGCKKDDDSSGGDGDGYGCADLCDASQDEGCGDYDDCMTECEQVSELCSSEVEAYLECAADATEVSCVGEETSLAIAAGCTAEAVAIRLCAVPGDGDMGDGDMGDGDMGDGDMGDGDMGDGDGDMGGATGGGAGGGGGVGGAN